MSNFRDPIYLVSEQYKDAGNLSDRIQLHERYSTNPCGWFQWMFDQIELPPTARILEVGCGSGKLWLENLGRIQPNWQITLSDFSPGMANSCRTSLALSLDRFSIEVSDAMAIPFPHGTFDAVIANHMLYHVPDLPRALAEFSRILKPGGTLYAATNGENHLFELDALIEQVYQPADSYLFLGKPSRHFTLENGAAQLAPWFKQVNMRHYPDSLVVTDAKPLVAYVKSMIPRGQKQDEQSSDQHIEQAVNDLLGQQGCFRIQKSCGIFIGKR